MNAAVRLGFAEEEPGRDLVLAMAEACMHVRPAAFDTQVMPTCLMCRICLPHIPIICPHEA